MIEQFLKEYIELLVTERIRTVTKERFDMRHFQMLDNTGELLYYAETRLQYLGAGSSRAVYALGQNKVLKIAMNKAGIGQNEAEAKVHEDPIASMYATKILAKDPDHMWLIVETARQAKVDDFELVGIPKNKFHEVMMDVALGDDYTVKRLGKQAREFVRGLYKFMQKSGLIAADVKNISSWGVTADRRLVLLDYGYTYDVYKKHYKLFPPRGRQNVRAREKA